MTAMPGRGTNLAKVTAGDDPLAAQGVELVEVQFTQPPRGRATLRVFVDREGGITLGEIAKVSRVVSELLDVHDLIGPAYTLEVSSPGLTRKLKEPRDYERYTGRLVRLTTKSIWQGKQVHRGRRDGGDRARRMQEMPSRKLHDYLALQVVAGAANLA